MNASDRCIELIKEFEGFQPSIYLCLAGKPTIGFGHVVRGDIFHQPITEKDAEELLLHDLDAFYGPAVLQLVAVDMTQGQFDALVSFTYNLGCGSLERSTLLKKLNAGDYQGAADEFERWDKCNGKPIAGLARRRHAEKALFLS